MLHYGNQKLETEFQDTRLDPRLKAIVLLATAYTFYKFGEVLWLTSVYRPDDPGVHGLWRGVDLDNDAGLNKSQKQEICDYINWLFTYDPERSKFKVCLYHTVLGRGGDHLHFQVHPNTIMNGASKLKEE